MICLTLRLNRQPRKKKITISTPAKLTAIIPWKAPCHTQLSLILVWNIPVVFILAVYIDYQYSVSAMICLTIRLNRQPRKKNNNFNPYKINRNYSMKSPGSSLNFNITDHLAPKAH
jgi:hypothetical protein